MRRCRPCVRGRAQPIETLFGSSRTRLPLRIVCHLNSWFSKHWLLSQQGGPSLDNAQSHKCIFPCAYEYRYVFGALNTFVGFLLT